MGWGHFCSMYAAGTNSSWTAPLHTPSCWGRSDTPPGSGSCSGHKEAPDLPALPGWNCTYSFGKCGEEAGRSCDSLCRVKGSDRVRETGGRAGAWPSAGPANSSSSARRGPGRRCRAPALRCALDTVPGSTDLPDPCGFTPEDSSFLVTFWWSDCSPQPVRLRDPFRAGPEPNKAPFQQIHEN